MNGRAGAEAALYGEFRHYDEPSPLLLKRFGLGGACGFYAFFALVSLFFVLRRVRETKGETLEEM